jgi:hypothetical protein
VGHDASTVAVARQSIVAHAAVLLALLALTLAVGAPVLINTDVAARTGPVARVVSFVTVTAARPEGAVVAGPVEVARRGHASGADIAAVVAVVVITAVAHPCAKDTVRADAVARARVGGSAGALWLAVRAVVARIARAASVALRTIEASAVGGAHLALTARRALVDAVEVPEPGVARALGLVVAAPLSRALHGVVVRVPHETGAPQPAVGAVVPELARADPIT